MFPTCAVSLPEGAFQSNDTFPFYLTSGISPSDPTRSRPVGSVSNYNDSPGNLFGLGVSPGQSYASMYPTGTLHNYLNNDSYLYFDSLGFNSVLPNQYPGTYFSVYYDSGSPTAYLYIPLGTPPSPAAAYSLVGTVHLEYMFNLPLDLHVGFSNFSGMIYVYSGDYLVASGYTYSGTFSFYLANYYDFPTHIVIALDRFSSYPLTGSGELPQPTVSYQLYGDDFSYNFWNSVPSSFTPSLDIRDGYYDGSLGTGGPGSFPPGYDPGGGGGTDPNPPSTSPDYTQNFQDLENAVNQQGQATQDAINQQGQATQDAIKDASEQASTERKGILQAIVDLPSTLIQKFTDFFLPTQEQIEEINNQYKELLNERFGFFAQAGQLLNSLFTGVYNALSSGSVYEFNFPGISFSLFDTEFTLVPTQKVSLDNAYMDLCRPIAGTGFVLLSMIALVNTFINFWERLIDDKFHKAERV